MTRLGAFCQNTNSCLWWTIPAWQELPFSPSKLSLLRSREITGIRLSSRQAWMSVGHPQIQSSSHKQSVHVWVTLSLKITTPPLSFPQPPTNKKSLKKQNSRGSSPSRSINQVRMLPQMSQVLHAAFLSRRLPQQLTVRQLLVSIVSFSQNDFRSSPTFRLWMTSIKWSFWNKVQTLMLLSLVRKSYTIVSMRWSSLGSCSSIWTNHSSMPT